MFWCSIHFSVCCGIILASTFIPRGAFSFNPKAIGSIGPNNPSTSGVESDDSSEKEYKKSELTEAK